MRVGILAIETSGDRLGAELMHSLRRLFPGLDFVGCGGDAMQAEGMDMLAHTRDIEAFGIVEVLVRLVPLLRIRRGLLRGLTAHKIDLFIGIDGPDMNGYFERRLSALGIPCVHYVCPTIWAWRPQRARFFSACNKRILCLYPYECQLIEAAGGKASFVGHPLADTIPLRSSRLAARRSLELHNWATGRRLVGLLPGSRTNEITRLLPVFLQAAQRLAKEQPELGFVVSAVNCRQQPLVESLLTRHARGLDYRLVVGQSQRMIAASNVMLVASGTASLETLLIKRPMVIAYKVNWLTWLLTKMHIPSNFVQHCLLDGKKIERSQDAGLPLVGQPNLLGGGELVPEYLQHLLNPGVLVAACKQLLTNNNRQLMRRFDHIHLELRQNAAASAASAIAPLIASLVKK